MGSSRFFAFEIKHLKAKDKQEILESMKDFPCHVYIGLQISSSFLSISFFVVFIF